LRIIGGTARGRKIFAPPQRGKGKTGIRPTGARAREALFNILGTAVDNGDVLDLFAGTGAMGLEALSRGARSAVFVDSSQAALKAISRNLQLCGFVDRATVVRHDLAGQLVFLRELSPLHGFTLIFSDPPYGYDRPAATLAALDSAAIMHEKGLLVYEYDARGKLPETCGRLQLVDSRRYGAAGFWFYRCRET
jgi:16S rRNA (guanine966-N2)-methyltransferase